MDEAAFETDEERALWSTLVSTKGKIYPGTCSFFIKWSLMEFRLFFPMGHASCWVWDILQFALIWTRHLLNWTWDKPIYLTGIEIDDFVEISSELLQPLEDFFNNVFVMVVCFLRDSIIYIINVYIRCGKLHLRVYVDERNLHALVLPDLEL